MAKPNHRSAYVKFQIHERPSLGLALWLETPDNALTFTAARVAIGCVGPFPRAYRERKRYSRLASELEKRLDDAADAIADSSDLLDDHEGSAAYKRHLIHVFLRRAFLRVVGDSAAR